MSIDAEVRLEMQQAIKDAHPDDLPRLLAYAEQLTCEHRATVAQTLATCVDLEHQDPLI